MGSSAITGISRSPASCSNTSGCAQRVVVPRRVSGAPAIGRHDHISGAALDSHHRVLAVVARPGPDGGQDDHRPAIQCSSFAPVGGLVECQLLANVAGTRRSCPSCADHSRCRERREQDCRDDKSLLPAHVAPPFPAGPLPPTEAPTRTRGQGHGLVRAPGCDRPPAEAPVLTSWPWPGKTHRPCLRMCGHDSALSPGWRPSPQEPGMTEDPWRPRS